MSRFYRDAFQKPEEFVIEIGQSSLIGHFSCPHCRESFAQEGRFVSNSNKQSYCSFECVAAVDGPVVASKIARRQVIPAPPRRLRGPPREIWMRKCREHLSDADATTAQNESIVLKK
jgi:hypothetical protein